MGGVAITASIAKRSFDSSVLAENHKMTDMPDSIWMVPMPIHAWLVAILAVIATPPLTNDTIFFSIFLNLDFCFLLGP